MDEQRPCELDIDFAKLAAKSPDFAKQYARHRSQQTESNEISYDPRKPPDWSNPAFLR